MYSFFISCFPLGPESDPVEIVLNTSDLTKCEWCNVRKLPVVFLQAVPPIYQKLSMQLQMNKEEKVWNDCKGMNRLTSKFCRQITTKIEYGLLSSRIGVFGKWKVLSVHHDKLEQWLSEISHHHLLHLALCNILTM